MGTDSDDVRNYIGRLERDSRDLAALRAVLDRFRETSVVDDGAPGPHPTASEDDIEVVSRLSMASSRELADAKERGILLGLRAAAMLARDHDGGDEHDATLAEKIGRMTSEGAVSLVGAVRRSTPPKPCPLRFCVLANGHAGDHECESRSISDNTTDGAVLTHDGARGVWTWRVRNATVKPPIKLRAGQIWRTKDGTEIQITINPPSSMRQKWQLGAEAVISVDADNTITDTGGCTLVYDPRGM